MTANDPDRSRGELDRALGSVPAYASWRVLDPGEDATVDERYAALPATTKQWMRARAPHGFVPAGLDLADALAREDVEIAQTSGTHGAATTLPWYQPWWDASERASWSLNAHASAVATGTHREAVLASPLCVGPGLGDRPLSAQERTLGPFLFINEDPDVARWTDRTVHRMHDELERFDPVVLVADPWYLAELCARAETLGLRLPLPRLVVFTYALPSKIQLARIARALPVPTASSYGSTETGYVFLSCEHGRMHQNVASCRVDLVPLRAHIGEPALGRPLVTPFGNPWMCILRFDVGDLLRLSSGPCPCGRTQGMLLDRIEGRVEDTTLRTDGRIVSAAELDDALASAPSCERIVAYQLDQLAPDEYRLHATTTGPLDAGAIRACLRDVYGPGARIDVRTVFSLVPERSGKYTRARTRFHVDRDAWFDR